MKKILGAYKNGNYSTIILKDGTKIRQTMDDKFIPEFAENCDVKITDKCDGGCQFCFPPNNNVTLYNNIKDISEIKIGDIVKSYNHNTKCEEWKKVTQKFEREYNGEIIIIELENGKIIKCTPNHKIYTINRGYIRADELKETDELY